LTHSYFTAILEVMNNRRVKSLALQKSPNVILLMLFSFIVGAVGSYFTFHANAAKPTQVMAITSPSLYITPSSAKLSINSSLSLQIWAETNNQNVNAVQVNLSYPASQLQFVNFDSSNSAFTISAQSTSEGGVIKIARGNTTPLSGRLLVGTVNFTSIAHNAKAMVNFSAGSALVSSTTNTDILTDTKGGIYTLR
jgi:hypothetical protein